MYINKNKLILFFILLLNGQMFAATASNPFGIKGSEEFFLIFLICWTSISIFIKSGKISKTDFIVVSIPLVLSAYSALASGFVFSQPAIFSLLEERRVFGLWIYFPIVDFLRYRKIDTKGVEALLVLIAILCALATMGVKLGILPGITETRSAGVRGARISVGGSYMAAMLPLVFLTAGNVRSRIKETILGTLLIATITIFIQGRQLMLGIVPAVWLSFTLLTKILLIFLLFSVIAIFSHQILETLDTYISLFSVLLSPEYLKLSWRAQGYSHAIMALREGHIFGHGALSPLWNEGFKKVIGEYFFLADIGIIGSTYRYGLLGIMIYVLWLFWQLKIIIQIPSGNRQRSYLAMYLFLVILLPVAAPFEYRPFITGVLLAISTMSENHERK